MRYTVAIYREASIFSTILEPKFDSRYALIYPIAVRRVDNEIVILEPIWTQCRSPRAAAVTITNCVVYYPDGIDAIIYLRKWVNGWREVDVQCVSGDMEFCEKLKRCTHNLWVGPVRVSGRRLWLGPSEVATALPSACR
jgi:hypothetical protein